MIPGTTKRSPAPQAGAPWMPHETTALLTLLAEGLEPQEIAGRIGRSKDSVTGHMKKLRTQGLLPPVVPRNLWKPEESARLVEMRRAGRTLEEMAEALGRPYESVRTHIATLRTRGVNITVPPRVKRPAPKRSVTPEPAPERIERKCLGFECSRKFLAVSRFQRMCEICRAQAKRVCW